MTIERAIRLASAWSQGHVCTLRDGDAEEYHKMALEAFRAMQEAEKNEPMTLELEKTILLLVIETWGEDDEIKMVLEEMSELQKEICKRWMGRDNAAAIAEEIADVEITLNELKMILHAEDDVKRVRAQKLHRLAERLVCEVPGKVERFRCPCEGCDTSWGAADATGISSSCEDICERLKA